MNTRTTLMPLFYTDTGTYGFAATDTIGIDAYWGALKLDVLSNDGNGYIQVVTDIDRIVEAVDGILALFKNPNAPAYIFPTNVAQIFSEGRAAMATLTLASVENEVMGRMKGTYGIVPMPKLNAAQESYGTQLHSQYLTVVASPATLYGDDRYEAVGAFLEAMSSTGHNVVRPAYIDGIFGSHNPVTRKMAHLITEGIRVDLGMVYAPTQDATGSGHCSALQGIIEGGLNTAASRFKSIQKATSKSLLAWSKKMDKVFTTLYG